MKEIKLQITAQGGIRMLHDDAINLAEFGDVEVSRASHVEFSNETQSWFVTSAKTGAYLGFFETRAEALAFEKGYYSPGGPGWEELTS